MTKSWSALALGDSILVDRHHADLLYSLQRLFEDRLGISVYVPIGMDWWERGYWRFGECFGDDRLAQQYLHISDGVWSEIGDGMHVTYDTAHPGRAIRGVEVTRACRMDWRFVMPSVQENLPGYRRLANELGSTLLYHVGNTGQYIDWDLDPLIISTSEAPLREGQGIIVHQEIDSEPGGAFGYRCPPAHVRCVRNAVNAFNRLPGYAEFLEAEEALAPEGWEFTVHGHEGRDGDVNPVDALGALMASAGFGWHDKPVGDGFGHVVHSWAAVGRPLVGRGAYYAGRLAEPFWEDGITCLDLDARPLEDTIELLRSIASDPLWHESMCREIRARFDALVDYEAEAELVASFLGIL